MIQTILALFAAILTTATPATTITGTYYNYMVVEGNNGNDYLIENPKDYLVYDEVYQDYIPVFKQGEPVIAVVTDDIAVKVCSVEQ